MADEAQKCECASDTAVEGIRKMAEVFEETSKEAWEMLVRQQMIDGIFDFLLCCVFFGVAAIVTSRIIKWTRSENFDWNDGDYAIPTILAGLACTACFITTTCIGFNSIKQLLNPSYYAAIELIQEIK